MRTKLWVFEEVHHLVLIYLPSAIAAAHNPTVPSLAPFFESAIRDTIRRFADRKRSGIHVCARGSDRARVLKIVRQFMKPDIRVFVGVVSPTDPRIETAEEVRDRILEAAEHIPADPLGTTDDCGFAPSTTSRDTAFTEIRSRVLDTILASESPGSR